MYALSTLRYLYYYIVGIPACLLVRALTAVTTLKPTAPREPDPKYDRFVSFISAQPRYSRQSNMHAYLSSKQSVEKYYKRPARVKLCPEMRVPDIYRRL
ncbi:hypothetical protein GGS24DRAFT_155383 [Hypoxylon argillaceum]|nr:hypothetical protein GGS24DRAFT_155383 [Hypoxylon argillaceum]KAI1157107.1 hypothetical protein F4825DRAFT_400685 [Nemania diffusa]